MSSSPATQFVAFATKKSPQDFVRDWQPIAERFLRSGLRTITLAEVSEITDADSSGVRFVSRNSWPAHAYQAVFPSGAPAEMTAGGMVVTQPGVFEAALGSGVPIEGLQDRRYVVLAFVASDLIKANGVDAAELRTALTGVLPNDHVVHLYAKSSLNGEQRYELAVSVHTNEGDDESEVIGSTTATARVLAALLSDLVPSSARLVLAGREILTLNRGTLQ